MDDQDFKEMLKGRMQNYIENVIKELEDEKKDEHTRMLVADVMLKDFIFIYFSE